MSTSPVSPTPGFQAQEDFRENRIKWIGGSDIGSLFNLAPYGCELRLFKMKTEVVPDFPFFGNSATSRGQRWEPIAAEVYREKTGRTIRRCHPKADEVATMLRPQPDYEIVNDARGPEWGRGMLSIKNPGREMFLKIKQAITALTNIIDPKTEWERKQLEDGKNALRPYILQLQSEFAGQKVKWGSFGVYWPDGDDIVYVDIEADAGIISNIRDKAIEFWRSKEMGIAPPKLDPKARQCKTCEFRVTCQQAHLLALLEKEAGDGETAIIPELDGLVAEIRALQEPYDELEEQIDAKKAEIKQLLEAAQADVGQGNAVLVYNRLQSGRQTFQQAQFFKAYPDLKPQAEKFFNQGAPFRVLKMYDRAKKG